MREFLGWTPEERRKLRFDLERDMRLRFIGDLVCEAAEFCEIARVLREYLGGGVNVDEGAVSIDATLK